MDDQRRRLKNYAARNPTKLTPYTQTETNERETAHNIPRESTREMAAEYATLATDGSLEMTDDEDEPRPKLEVMKKIRKWGCRFSGKKPVDFLKRVEELRRAHELTGEQLLPCLPELFQGDA